MRVRDCRYREPSLGSLERAIAGFSGGFAGTEDQFRDLESFQWARSVAQEVFMNWNQLEASWKQIKDKVVFHWERLRPDDGNGVDLIGRQRWGRVKAVIGKRPLFAPTTA
jgi:hypothetical protein